MDLALEKLNLIQQILLFDEDTFARLQHLVAAQGLAQPADSATLSDAALAAQFHEAHRQAAAGETYSTAEVLAMTQQWRIK